MTVATTTGTGATVDVAHEASSHRIGPRTDGADLVVTMGDLLRLAVLAGRDASDLASARAAALGAYADVVATLTSTDRLSFTERAALLRDARPTVVLIVAGKKDADATLDQVEALRFACGAGAARPLVLVAAEEGLRARVIASAAPLSCETVPSPAERQGREAIVARLRALRREGSEVVLRDEAIEAAARALAAVSRRSTLLLDVTGASTSLALALPHGVLVAAHAHIGVGPRADRVVARAGLDRVRRWMPRPIDAPALLERVFNRARWPDAVAPNALTLALEMSLAREALAQLFHEAARAGLDAAAMRGAQTVVATGDLARLPRGAQTALVVIDALGSGGTQLIARERPDALVVAGAIASRAAADMTEATEDLALVLASWPKRAHSVTVVDDNGTTTDRVVRGTFFVVPTSGSATITVTGSTAHYTAGALSLGVIVDARGRPLELPPRDAERLPTIARWYAALAALPIEGGTR